MSAKLNLTNENYCATVVKATPLLKLDGLDNLVAFPIYGFQALIGKNNLEGELGILFTAECQLSPDFCKNNNLYTDCLLNADTTIKGYISPKRRVRAIRLRGHDSSALFMPLSSLLYIGADLSGLKEGDQFNEINGVEICTKYVIRNQRGSGQGKQKQGRKSELNKKKIVAKLFPEHIDTTHWAKSAHLFDDDQEVIVCDKIHGCVYKDTIVETLEYGKIRIEEIVDKKIQCKILSHNISTNEDEYQDIVNHFFVANNGEWFEIELENGQNVIITGNNPVWLPKLKCYRRVDELYGDEEIQFLENSNI